MSDEFETFVREHQDMVYSTAMGIVGSAGDAEDIAQQTFLRAWEMFAELRTHPNAGGWLRLSARNAAINHFKRHIRRWRFFGSMEEVSEGSGYPVESNGGDDDDWLYSRAEALKVALVKLAGKFRVPLVLFYYEGQSYEEIASLLECTTAKVKTDLFRARAKLRELLGESEGRHGKE